MKLSAYCMQCVVNMQAKQIQHLADEEAKSDYLRQVLEIIALSDPGDSAPVLLEKMNRIYEERFEPLPDFTEIKEDYNRLMLSLEEDAEQVSLGTVARVVSNGSPVAGTDLKSISGEAEQILRRADVILAKGQANYETLKDSGLNIYYLFLAKCQWFRNAFHLSENRGMFVRERS